MAAAAFWPWSHRLATAAASVSSFEADFSLLVSRFIPLLFFIAPPRAPPKHHLRRPPSLSPSTHNIFSLSPPLSLPQNLLLKEERREGGQAKRLPSLRLLAYVPSKGPIPTGNPSEASHFVFPLSLSFDTFGYLMQNSTTFSLMTAYNITQRG